MQAVLGFVLRLKQKNKVFQFFGRQRSTGLRSYGNGYGRTKRIDGTPATPEFHAQITTEGGYFINNQKIVKAFTDEMPARVFDLERYGVMFDRKEDGNFYVWADPSKNFH